MGQQATRADDKIKLENLQIQDILLDIVDALGKKTLTDMRYKLLYEMVQHRHKIVNDRAISGDVKMDLILEINDSIKQFLGL